MAVQKKIKYLDPADGKTYEVTLDESSRTELTDVSTIKTKIIAEMAAYSGDGTIGLSADEQKELANNIYTKLNTDGHL